MKPNYHWWPISFGWCRDWYCPTLMMQIRHALSTLKWDAANPKASGFKCAEALRVHRRAAWRIWHGWPIGNSATEYGRTVHFGRFKIYFGRRG